MPSQSELKRAISLPLLIFYGLGTILGAGIYALIGKVAKHAEMAAPWAFMLAALIAFFTAMSYAELSSRFPKSGGEALYVKNGFNLKWLSGLTGWLIVITAVISSAAIANGFAGYLQVFISMPEFISIICIVVLMGAIAFWGIKESALMAAMITLIEIAGLILVIVVCSGEALQSDQWSKMIPEFDIKAMSGILSGSFIAFYAFIGFEDIVNVAEEVKNPEKTMRTAIVIVMLVATTLYVLVALSVTMSVPIDQLAESKAPFATVLKEKGVSEYIITLISLVAMVNGILVQIVMSARVLYGMAKQNTAPQFYAHVYAKTKTPHLATLTIVILVILAALSLPIERLAQATSFVLIIIFILVNLSLLNIKRKEKDKRLRTYIFPVLGAILSALFLLGQGVVYFLDKSL